MNIADAPADPFIQFKAAQRETWSGFAANEGFTTPPAAHLVRFAAVTREETVLDVACGTGVVAVTAALAGAHVKGLDLTPALLERARHNAALSGAEIEFTEGDAEALPYPDASFDVVLSQFGHMFAPRPEVVTAEMLRVLKPGGRIAFSTWPPEHGMGQLFALIARHQPAPLPGAPNPPPPVQWGDPTIVRERLGARVIDLHFDRGVAMAPALSPQHWQAFFEGSFSSLGRAVAALASQPERLSALRAEASRIIAENFADNWMRQHFLLSRATKR